MFTFGALPLADLWRVFLGFAVGFAREACLMDCIRALLGRDGLFPEAFGTAGLASVLDEGSERGRVTVLGVLAAFFLICCILARLGRLGAFLAVVLGIFNLQLFI